MVNLLHLALADFVGGVADPATGLSRLERGGQVEGVGEEVIAQQYGRLVTPLGIDRRGMATDHGLVEDIVVNESRRVDHLDDRSQDGMGLAERAAWLGRSRARARAEAVCPGNPRSDRPVVARREIGCRARSGRFARPRRARPRSVHTDRPPGGGFPRLPALVVVTSTFSLIHVADSRLVIELRVRSARAIDLRSSRDSPIGTATAPGFLLELDLVDHHRAVDGLAHVIDRQGSHATAVRASISTPVRP